MTRIITTAGAPCLSMADFVAEVSDQMSQASEAISGSRAPPPLQWERCICGSGSD